MIIDYDDDDDGEDSCREWCPSFTRTILERSAVVVVVCRRRGHRHRYVTVDSLGAEVCPHESRVE